MTDVTTGKVPVLECFGQAWRFLFEHWRLFVPAAVVPALANGLALALSPVSPVEAPGMVSQLTGAAIVAIASLFFVAAVLRKAIRDEFTPPWGLAAGQDEIRLLGVLGCLVVTFVAPALLVSEILDQLVIKRVAQTP